MGLNMLEYDRSRPEMKTFVVDATRPFSSPATLK